MPANFPHTSVRPIESWSNFHHTITGRKVAECFRLEDVPTTSASGGAHTLRRQGDAIGAVLDHCFASGKRVTIPGSRWSLSDVLSPGDVILDGNNNAVKTPKDYQDAVAAARAAGKKDIVARVQCGQHELCGDASALRTSEIKPE